MLATSCCREGFLPLLNHCRLQPLRLLQVLHTSTQLPGSVEWAVGWAVTVDLNPLGYGCANSETGTICRLDFCVWVFVTVSSDSVCRCKFNSVSIIDKMLVLNYRDLTHPTDALFAKLQWDFLFSFYAVQWIYAITSGTLEKCLLLREDGISPLKILGVAFFVKANVQK